MDGTWRYKRRLDEGKQNLAESQESCSRMTQLGVELPEHGAAVPRQCRQRYLAGGASGSSNLWTHDVGSVV